MVDTYFTVLAWVFWIGSGFVASCQAVATYKKSNGKEIVIGPKTSLIGLLSFIWLVVRYWSGIVVAMKFIALGLFCIFIIFLISWYVTIIFEKIEKAKRRKALGIKNCKNPRN